MCGYMTHGPLRASASSNNSSILGKFGEIQLSKSCVGVPLKSQVQVNISASIGLLHRSAHYKASVSFVDREEWEYSEIVFATSDVKDPFELTVNWNVIDISNFYYSKAE